MALKKSDLYASLWSACDDLRGGMDPSQYKDYILVLLFIKYVSDKYAGNKHAPIVIPEGASFADMVALKGKADIGDQINKKIIAPLQNANPESLSDMPDFNDPNKLGTGQEMVDRLTNLIALFETRLNFAKNRAEGDDILGDAYEYFMRNFATESGKSKGQFYTPSEVSRVIASLVGIDEASPTNSTTVYDPTCGSGSLLLKVADAAFQENGARVSLYGQENEAITASLARMNMVLHDNPTSVIHQGNTITTPQFKDGLSIKTFDYVVANPPFSNKRWSTGLNADNEYGRFSGYGARPPKKQGDYAFLLHIIASLKTTGQGACVLPHGVLFRGNAEAVIRRNIVQRGYIKAIIGLPGNLFFGTGIPACILVLDKKGAASRTGIFMVNASTGFTKDASKNRLREQDIHRIIDVYTKQTDVPGYARMVPIAEISDPKNAYNLNIPRYIDSIEVEDIQDVEAHIKGGIPVRDVDMLEPYWKTMPALRDQLLAPDRPGYLALRVSTEEISPIVSECVEFEKFRKSVRRAFAKWRTNAEPLLRALEKDASPKQLIGALSETLLAAFHRTPLLDPYDLYQDIMEYWAEVLQDDAYMISIDGWLGAAKPREITQQRNKDNKLVWAESHDILIEGRRFKSDLLPASLLQDRYFIAERDAIGALEAELDGLGAAIDAEKEEHAVEGGLLEDAAEFDEDKVKITKQAIDRWLRENKDDPELVEELETAARLRDLMVRQSAVKAEIKTLTGGLYNALAEKYTELSESEIKDLVVENKWLHRIETSVGSVLASVERRFVERLVELAERYLETVQEQVAEVGSLAASVADHIAEMGIE